MRRHFAGWVLAGAAALGAGAAQGQTIYQPVQYQYGRYGEIFYGGTNPWFLSEAGLFMPDVPRNAATGAYGEARPARFYTAAMKPMTERFGFASPEYRPERYDTGARYWNPRPILFTDLAPYEEAGRYGFTIDDARNEAYFNVPRYYAGPAVAEAWDAMRAGAAGAGETRETPPARRGEERRPGKAIPLLNWVRMESAKERPNELLIRALLWEAQKHDAAATAKVRAAVGR